MYFIKKTTNISGVTSASVTRGDRSITTIVLEDSKINTGYKLRFKTTVEDQKYHTNDLEVALTTEQLSAKIEGKNYMRYIRLSKI
jgi:exopolysaccharide biosynthesis protein